MEEILIVDSDHAIRSMLTYTLTTEHFSVLEARDGIEAFSRLSAGLNPDLIITGLNVHRNEGVSFIRKIRTTPDLRFTPILMLTDDHTQYRQLEWKEAGATGWITVPFTSDELLEMVKIVIFKKA
ncbi:MAG: response regulator [Deltaproteobacteria bacterium]|nr:response regulator [Deltaproteobacteria bacterium]